MDRARESIGFGGRPLAYLDLEFTGLDPALHDITEIAVLLPAWAPHARELGTEVVEDWYAWCVKTWPTRLEHAEPRALEVNGFDEQIWSRESIPLGSALNSLMLLLDRVTVVGHNLEMDVAFLRHAFRRCQRQLAGEPPDLKYKVDTSTLIWEHLVPLGLTRGNLHDACEALQINNEGEHSALPDVLRTKAVVDALVFGLGPGTLEGSFDRIAAIEAARRTH